MAKFNINQLLRDTSLRSGGNDGIPTGAESPAPRRTALKVIPIGINDLIPSKDNFYSVGDLTELKISIEMFGVVQNLTVTPLADGKYKIIAGHRRHRACAELVAEGKPEFEYVPCGVLTDKDEIKERILLNVTNSTTRELTDWERMKQAEELHTLFAALKKRGNLPGRVRDLVAEALSASATQIARMSAISKNLAPELAEGFKAGRLGVSVAYELSGMSAEKQREAAAELREKGALSLNDVKARKREASSFDADRADLMREVEEGERKSWEDFKNAGKTAPSPVLPPAREPKPQKTYPETPKEFEENRENEENASESRDFADMSVEEKAEAAIELLNRGRFKLFGPGEDTRIFDFIVDVVERAGGL